MGDLALPLNRDLGALIRLGGWKSEKMVLRYAHVNVGELAHTIERLPWGKCWGTLSTKGEKRMKARDLSVMRSPLVRERSRVQSSLAAPVPRRQRLWNASATEPLGPGGFAVMNEHQSLIDTLYNSRTVRSARLEGP